MSKSLKLKNDNYWDSSSIVHNKQPLDSSFLKKMESGLIKMNQMQVESYEGAKRIYNLTFSNSYTQSPNVIVCYWNDRPNMYGDIGVSVANINNIGCKLQMNNNIDTPYLGIQYLVISND